MNIVILGAAGFIGTNLVLELLKDEKNKITLVDRNYEGLNFLKSLCQNRAVVHKCDLILTPDFEKILIGQDVVYQLISTTIPITSNRQISKEINDNVKWMSQLLEICVKCKVQKIVFLSSGGAVYGMKNICPLREEMDAYPINSYGMQKLMNEKLLYLYHYVYGLDYRIIRLANPYGPYQRPNGIQGAATTFIYKIMKNEPIVLYGDGSVIRDYIYIDDAVRAIVNIANGEGEEKIYNVGSGKGVSLHQLLKKIESVLGISACVNYFPARSVDVPVNYLDISKYENSFGDLISIPLEVGIQKTADFLRN